MCRELCKYPASEDVKRKDHGVEQGASPGDGSRVKRAQGSVGYQTDAGRLTPSKTGPVA